MISKIRNIAKSNGYIIYREPYKLNIWGFRSKNEEPNLFDDEFHVFFNTSKTRFAKWAYFVFKCTTDPGTYWLRNPMNPQGTAMLAPGQYTDTYKIDMHLGKYIALCQRLKKVRIIRDYNRNAILDFYNGKIVSENAGINIHRARKTGTTYEVDNHSAGCQVFQKANEFDFFMKLCYAHKKLHGNKFSYTLIDQRMEFRALIRRSAIGLASATILALGYLWSSQSDQKVGVRA